MSTQTFSVIVEPRRWSRSTDELAWTLSPLIGVSPPVLSSLLLRGPMTVEADLSHAAALSLCSRLVGAGVPASIQGAGDRTISDRVDVGEIESMLEAMGIAEIEVDDEIGLVSTAGVSDFSAQITNPMYDQQVHRSEGAEIRVPVLSRREETTAPKASTGWSSLFPDMEAAVTEPVKEDVFKTAPGLFELGEEVYAPKQKPEPGDEDVTSQGADRKKILQEVLLRDSQNASAAINALSKPAASSETSSDGPAIRRSVESILAPKEAERPPYAPTGFDDRNPHSPKLAKVLSALAPGAGQVYNGDDEAALSFATQAWKIKPWMASTRHAERRAERIQEYFLPWPEEGSLFRATKFLLTFWLILGMMLTVVVLVGRGVLPMLDREPLPGITAEDLDFAYSNAKGKVLEARVKSLDAVAEEMQNSEKPRFTMTDKERAERLYLMGYQDCVSKQFEQCETVMRKVTAMDPSNRDAFRLQTWASAQRQTPDSTKMPDVGEVETLEEYELRMMQEEPND